MNEVYLCLGGNMGNREDYLQTAIEEIKQIEGLTYKESSSIYETASWGNDALPPFLNQIIVFDYLNEPDQLIKELLEIESKLGRKRHANMSTFESRAIDLDIIFFGNKIIDSKDLVVPHPRLHQRKFVLVPLNELCPDQLHPLLQLSVKELLAICKDKSAVTKSTVRV